MTQYIHDSLSAEVVQPLKTLMLIKKDIKEEELGAIFKACGETIENKTDKVNKTELLELLVEEVIKMGFFVVPIL